MDEFKLKKVGVAGTFDKLHKGHKLLLLTAFSAGERVIIGITSEKLIKGKKMCQKIAPFDERVKKVKEFLSSRGFKDYNIIKLDDPYGPAINDPLMDGLVVTRETLNNALAINKIRIKQGMKPLTLIVVPLVLAEDGLPISSTRIRLGEIDENGKLKTYSGGLCRNRKV
ncbi:MAG: phosphopantetheine adenylyltransferase [Candidatus Baldrarchaeia archaeon]